MTSVAELTPIQRFLGLPEDPQGPLELLGLTSEELDERSVRQALERRLARVGAHPEGRGHEADEVRLALHAAAAQARDPAVRGRLQAGAGRTDARPERRQLGRAGDSTIVDFRASALPAILRAGGLTRDSRRYIAALAHAHGMTVDDVHRALGAHSGPVATPSRWKSPPRAGGAAEPQDRSKIPVDRSLGGQPRSLYRELASTFEQEGSRVRRNATIAAGVAGGVIAALLVVGLATLALVDSSRPRERERVAESAPEPALGEAPATEPDQAADRAAEPVDAEAIESARRLAEIDLDDPVDPVALREAFELALAELPRAPTDAAWRFDRAVEQLSVNWTRLTPPERTALLERVVDFLYRAAPGGASGQRAIEAIAAGAERLVDLEPGGVMAESSALSAVWSVGALTRLSREEALPARVLGSIESHLARAVPVGRNGDASMFADGAAAALRVMGGRLSLAEGTGSDTLARDAWTRWFESIAAIEGAGSQSMLLLGVAERILIEGPSPATEPLALVVLEGVLQRVGWRTENGSTAAQRALISWFDDPRVATRDLAVVTEWLLESGAADGVGLRFVLRRTASSSGRLELRERYASLFSVASPSRADERSDWAAAANRLIGEKLAEETTTRYAQAATFARLNEAAARRWRGEPHGSGAVLSNLRGPVETALEQVDKGGGRVAGAGGTNDGKWAVAYLGAGQAVDRKLALLRDVDRRAGLGRIDAGVVAEAALYGGQEPVRRAAARIVRTHPDEATVVNGLLEALPSAARTESTSALIEAVTGQALPPVKQAAWSVAARRALVEKLLGLLAGGSDLAPIDALSEVIGASYAERAGSMGISTTTTPEAAVALWERWRAEAARYASTTDATAPMRELERRFTGRLRLARGPVQRFAAAQVSSAEMMGLVVAAERPSQIEAVRDVLERMGEARRSAGSIEAQLVATERAMAELWLIRFGEAKSGGRA